MFDKDGDGQITAKELVNVMKILGKPATFEEAKAMIKQVDKTGLLLTYTYWNENINSNIEIIDLL